MLASTLYAKGIICGDIRDEAQLNSITVMKRCQGLLNAVERQIKNSPSQFHHFMNVLNEEPASQDLYSLLKHTYGEECNYKNNFKAMYCYNIIPIQMKWLIAKLPLD